MLVAVLVGIREAPVVSRLIMRMQVLCLIKQQVGLKHKLILLFQMIRSMLLAIQVNSLIFHSLATLTTRWGIHVSQRQIWISVSHNSQSSKTYYWNLIVSRQGPKTNSKMMPLRPVVSLRTQKGIEAANWHLTSSTSSKVIRKSLSSSNN